MECRFRNQRIDEITSELGACGNEGQRKLVEELKVLIDKLADKMVENYENSCEKDEVIEAQKNIIKFLKTAYAHDVVSGNMWHRDMLCDLGEENNGE